METMPSADIASGFLRAAALTGIAIPDSDMEVQYLRAPHTPPSSLPKGKYAVYVFMFGDRCLKVGKAGSRSAARVCSQHYGVNRAPSALAKSVIKAGLGGPDLTLTAENVSEWLCQHTARINFLLPSTYVGFHEKRHAV